MAKIYEEAVRKARLLADGLTNNFGEVENYGINNQRIEVLKALADDAAEKNKELDELRALVSEKTKNARDILDELNATIKEMKMAVKPHFDQERWIRFGIEDKK